MWRGTLRSEVETIQEAFEATGSQESTVEGRSSHAQKLRLSQTEESGSGARLNVGVATVQSLSLQDRRKVQALQG